MEESQFSRVALQNGVQIGQGTSVLVRERVEFTSDSGGSIVFQPGDQFEITGFEYAYEAGDEGCLHVWFTDEAALTFMVFGDGFESGFAGLV